MKVKDNAIIPLTPAADHSASEGYFAEIDGNGDAAVVSSATAIPAGVIVDGEVVGGQDSVALMNHGGTFNVKLAGAVDKGDMLELTATGAVQEDSAAGARVIVARALEAGAADELIEASLLGPIVYSA